MTIDQDLEDGRRRVVVDALGPGDGTYAIKRVVGDVLLVRADILVDGHDVLDARLLHRVSPDAAWRESPLTHVSNDVFEGELPLSRIGRWEFTVEAWVDGFASFQRGLRRKVDAGVDVAVELLEGARLVAAAATRATGADATTLAAWAADLSDASSHARVDLATGETLARVMRAHPDRTLATRFAGPRAVVVEPALARFSAWYELFPRSCGPAGRHGTLDDVIARLDYVAEMGFDVLYLPPIHPIGRAHRKGPDNHPIAGPTDPGSPWAIGAAEGGHKSVHPELGTLEDFDRLIAAARARGIELALDVALQASPDHPYVSEHPEWFLARPDGTIQYAENPPKKYQDIVPFHFESAAWRSLWEELRSIFLFWIDRGVRVFRVDNPHTKPLAFWRWCIATIKERHPEILFLAEAFTRPKLMYALAKAGFSQSYTYFTWRTTSAELESYMAELAGPVADLYRPCFWPNTPDILPEHLQHGNRAVFIARLVLAATLSSAYGIYGPTFELMENVPRAGAEEYAASEKYELRTWDWERPDSLRHVIARVNRLRREHAALQSNEGLRFHESSNDRILCFSKATSSKDDVVLVVVNLDPHHRHSAWVVLDLAALGVGPGEAYQMHDRVSDARYSWRGARNFVELDPASMPASIFVIRHRVRTERSFEYYL